SSKNCSKVRAKRKFKPLLLDYLWKWKLESSGVWWVMGQIYGWKLESSGVFSVCSLRNELNEQRFSQQIKDATEKVVSSSPPEESESNSGSVKDVLWSWWWPRLTLKVVRLCHQQIGILHLRRSHGHTTAAAIINITTTADEHQRLETITNFINRIILGTKKM
ncbi:hypothetical protein M8C21_029810, partial [Ambrosia artemisiifolia]